MEEYKNTITLIYDEDLCLALGQKYNILPYDTLRSSDGRLCGAFVSSADIQKYIAEYEAGETMVNLRAFRAYEFDAQLELTQLGL